MSSANEWPMVKLGEIALIQAGGTPPRKNLDNFGPGLPWVKITDMDSSVVHSTEESITELGLENSSAKLFPEGTILLSIFATVGKVAVLDIPATTNQAIAGIQLNSDTVLPSFLVHFLKFSEERLKSLGRGVAQNNINLSKLRNFEIPLPPLAEQQRITEILDTSADALEKEERLQNSILPLAIELVERKISASSGALNDYIESMSSGKNVAESTDPNQKNRVLKVSAVTSGTFKPEESKPLPDTYVPPAEHQVRRGDVLVSRANTSQLLGASALVTNDINGLYLPDKIWRVVPKEGVDPYLLWGILQTKTARARISQRATGSSGSMKNISQKNFLQVPCATFSESKSTQLAALIREAVSLYHQVEQKLTLLRALHHSLSIRAFAGQL